MLSAGVSRRAQYNKLRAERLRTQIAAQPACVAGAVPECLSALRPAHMREKWKQQTSVAHMRRENDGYVSCVARMSVSDMGGIPDIATARNARVAHPGYMVVV